MRRTWIRTARADQALRSDIVSVGRVTGTRFDWSRADGGNWEERAVDGPGQCNESRDVRSQA